MREGKEVLGGSSTSSRSTNRASSRTESARSRHHARVVAQTPINASLHLAFERSEKRFDYSSSIEFNVSNSRDSNVVPGETISAYLQKMQRGNLVQSFGCLIAFNRESFAVIAFSENAAEMLELAPLAVPNIEQHEALSFGMDVRSLFRSPGAAAIQKAAGFAESNLLNPILVHSKTCGKPFYAILHRVDVGLVIDLEPVDKDDVPSTAAGALYSYKLAAKAISRLQALPSGNISLLCDVLVREVRELTGYDRVMVYKFHEDEHGEVIAEQRKLDVESYLGLHYPSTDIPQASRFLFMKNKVRMICDCLAPPVKVVQDESLAQPLSLGGSTLRAPHGCHVQYMENMGSIASLVMSATINEESEEVKSNPLWGQKLWGLVVCHHRSPRFIPFPLRYACEFLVQVFCVQLNKELELAAQTKEKHILQIQTMLCHMILRESPMGIITQSPNIMNLVKCDGAALYYKNEFSLLGVTPTKEQLKHVTQWLLEYHSNSTGLSTDSLLEAGYPRATELGDAVCGMAAVRISSTDFLFWFRSHTAKEIKWGGAKHDPVDKDDERRMHPRSSFSAFLEMVKRRSAPWEDMEMDAIHSLQLILRGSLQDDAHNSLRSEVVADDCERIVSVPEDNKVLQTVGELQTVTSEIVRLIQTAAVPIFAVDVSGCINGWNAKAAEITGLSSEQAVGSPLVHLVMDEATDVVKRMLSLGLQGIEEKNVEIKFKTYGPQEKNGPVVIVVNACCSRDTNKSIIGICFFGDDVTAQKMISDKYTKLEGDYAGIVRSACPLIPPIFVTNEEGICMEWNDAMEKLSGFNREAAVGNMLVGEVFTVEDFGCRVKDHDTLIRLRILLNRIMAGENVDKISFGFFGKDDRCIDALLSANARTDSEVRIKGAICFLHVASTELQYALQRQKFSEQAAANTVKTLSYVKIHIRSPICGMITTRHLMEKSDLSSKQRELVRTRELCEDQLAKIVNDCDISAIEEGYLIPDACEFNLGEALDAVMSQVMSLSHDRQVQVIHDPPREIPPMHLMGDNLRLQQALADFLSNAVRFAPVSEGSSVVLSVLPRKEQFGKNIHLVHLEFRITHPAPGIPQGLIQEMFHHSWGMSREGLGLYISHKLIKIMNGTVQYLRGEETSAFLVNVEFPLVN
ncbi:hypothetical protein Drorol1_Dr00019470 [Drosera rotundifolia]